MNLLSVIQSQFTPEMVNQISGRVGATPEGTKSALGAAVPASLASLVGKATSSPNGASDVFNMLKQGQGQNQGGSFDSASGMVSNLTGGRFNPSSSGSLLSSLFGSRLGGVTDAIASHAGIGGGAASSIIGMAAPLVMGVLGKHVASEGMGASGLGQLLGSQTQHLKDAMPAGVTNAMGLGNLFKGAEIPKVPLGAEARPPAEPMYARSPEPAYSGATDRRTAPAGGRLLGWLWVPVVIALIAWLFVHRSHNRQNAGGTGNETQTQSGYATSGNFTPGSPADKLAKAASAGNFNQPIQFQGLNFDNSGNVADSSKGQITQVASVLKSSPDLKVKITGYGATQDEGTHRADAIKSGLTSAGISADRVSTAGETGSQPPSMNIMK